MSSDSPQQTVSKVVVSVRAYCKMLLHALKYPHCQVNGVILSPKPKTKGITSFTVSDCVPLFHQMPLTLTPMYEIALAQIDIYCQKENLYVSGYYQANEHISDVQPDKMAYRVSDIISDNAAGATTCMLMIDNHKISVDCETIPLRAHMRKDSKWKPQDTNFLMIEGGSESMAAVSTLLRSKTYRELVDFDNHLDDISKDWKNRKIDNTLYHALQQ